MTLHGLDTESAYDKEVAASGQERAVFAWRAIIIYNALRANIMGLLKNMVQGPVGKALLALLSAAGMLLAVELCVGWWTMGAKVYPTVICRTGDPVRDFRQR